MPAPVPVPAPPPGTSTESIPHALCGGSKGHAKGAQTVAPSHYIKGITVHVHLDHLGEVRQTPFILQEC